MKETQTNAETETAQVIRMTFADFCECDFTFNDIFSGNADKIKDSLKRRKSNLASMKNSGDEIILDKIK